MALPLAASINRMDMFQRQLTVQAPPVAELEGNAAIHEPGPSQSESDLHAKFKRQLTLHLHCKILADASHACAGA